MVRVNGRNAGFSSSLHILAYIDTVPDFQKLEQPKDHDEDHRDAVKVRLCSCERKPWNERELRFGSMVGLK